MSYQFSQCEKQADGSVLIPSALVAHWQKEIETPYSELLERYKQSDRDEVAHILPIIDEYTKGEKTQIEREQHIRRRILWALKDNQDAMDKLLILLAGQSYDRALWEEISGHLADAQSHLNNGLSYLPEHKEDPVDWKTLVEQEITPPPWIR